MLSDEIYPSLIDGSSQNVFSVGLGSRAYLQSVRTEQVTQLSNLSESGKNLSCMEWVGES
jgi:hypothetical protein